MPSKRGAIFAGLCVVGAITIAGYAYHAKTRSAQQASGLTRPSAAVSQSDRAQAEHVVISGQPGVNSQTSAERVYFRYNGTDSHYGHVAFFDLKNPSAINFVDNLSCEVVYVAGGSGICLSADRGVVTTYFANLFDATTYRTRARVPLNGVPSRNRVSSNGNLAAFTVFVSGHGYAALDFSTQTLLLDAKTGATIADLESFNVIRDGRPFKSTDFNYWGVTFTPDSKEFYATLSSSGNHFLVRGNIRQRTATILHANVECPSLSPDGARVAFKKRLMAGNRVVWELYVLDLSTDKETPLAEKRSIDDQLEWLDNGHVLYSVADEGSSGGASTDVWVAAADGQRAPELFIRKANSPAAIRTGSP